MNLNGRLAIVTGGGRGIGRGITERLAAAGARVLIAQRQQADAELLRQAGISSIESDLLDADAPYRIAQAAEKLGGADILVNNAGFMFERHIEDMTEADWDQMMIVNLRAPVFLGKAVLGQMRARGGGSIINIGSIEGIGANPLHAAYCASKAGIHGLSRALAVDLGADGIRCNAIAPGWINSDLSNAYIDAQENPRQAWQGLYAMHPLGRTGEPADIGDMVVFLASEASAFITGQTFVVDGGRTAKLPLPF
jgi:meso-butanediol dehydrogenase/(S,S)-butanediol dehydrogenase/diacetyl reductase